MVSSLLGAMAMAIAKALCLGKLDGYMAVWSQ